MGALRGARPEQIIRSRPRTNSYDHRRAGRFAHAVGLRHVLGGHPCCQGTKSRRQSQALRGRDPPRDIGNLVANRLILPRYVPWSAVNTLSNSFAARSTILIPLIGYLILFNEKM